MSRVSRLKKLRAQRKINKQPCIGCVYYGLFCLSLPQSSIGVTVCVYCKTALLRFPDDPTQYSLEPARQAACPLIKDILARIGDNFSLRYCRKTEDCEHAYSAAVKAREDRIQELQLLRYRMDERGRPRSHDERKRLDWLQQHCYNRYSYQRNPHAPPKLWGRKSFKSEKP